MEKLPAIYLMTVQVIICTISISSYGLVSNTFTFDFSEHTGIFGFLSSHQCLYIFVIVGLFTGATMYASQGIALNYFSPLVMASAYLLEPLISQSLGCLLNLDKIPGIFTFLGTSISLGGIFMITKGGIENQKEKVNDEIPLVTINN
jgi:drug/metabolite transporter (DMT)-like permease